MLLFFIVLYYVLFTKTPFDPSLRVLKRLEMKVLLPVYNTYRGGVSVGAVGAIAPTVVEESPIVT